LSYINVNESLNGILRSLLDDVLIGLVGSRVFDERVQSAASQGIIHAVMATLALASTVENGMVAVFVAGEDRSGVVAAAGYPAGLGPGAPVSLCGVLVGKTVTCDPQEAASYWPEKIDNVVIRIVEYNDIVSRIRSLTGINDIGGSSGLAAQEAGHGAQRR
jgi:hypothetical protein